MLNGRPILGLNSDLVLNPIGNGLLAERAATEEVGDTVGQSLLAASDSNGAFDSFSAHGEQTYTSGLVSSTSAYVSNPTSRLVRSRGMSKPQVTSPLGYRLKRAMDARKIKESALIVALHDLVPGPEHEDLRGKLSQQMVNYLLKGGGERSFYTPFLAEALKVPCVWLAFGIGPDPFAEGYPPPLEISNNRERHVMRAFRNAEEPVKRAIEKALSSERESGNVKSLRPKYVPKKNRRVARLLKFV